MGFRDNAYNFSNDLQRIGSSLANAFIGNARDDAAIALANYRDAQTTGQELANRGMRGNLDAIDAAAKGNIIPRSIAQSLGYDVSNGNLIQPVLPGGPQMSVPAFGSDQVNMDSNALMTDLGNIARTLFGDGTSTANQVASALDTLGGAGSSRLAESMILSGDNNQAQRGALLMAPQGGQYQNPGFAMTELRTNDATARRDDDLNAITRSQKNVLESQDRRYTTDASETTKRELGLDLNSRREKWEMYKADQVLAGTQYKADSDADVAMYGKILDASVTRDKNVMADNTVRWKHKTRTIEMAVEPGKVIVLDPDTADRLGIPAVNDTNSKYNGLHIIDGGPKPGQVVVRVGREDVYMDEATANALGIPKVNGKFVVEGAGYKEDESTRNAAGGGDVTISTTDDNALLSAVDTAYTNNDFDLPDAVARAVRNKLVTEAVAQMGSKKNITTGRTFISKQLKKGFVTVEASVPGMFNDIEVDVPVFLIEEMNGETGVQAVDDAVKALDPAVRRRVAKTMLERLGYSPEEADAIVSQQVK